MTTLTDAIEAHVKKGEALHPFSYADSYPAALTLLRRAKAEIEKLQGETGATMTFDRAKAKRALDLGDEPYPVLAMYLRDALARIDELEQRGKDDEARAADIQMLAYKWMRAYDLLKERIHKLATGKERPNG